MKRPDITFVIGSMRIGGAERATLHLMNGLAAKGLTIEPVSYTHLDVYKRQDKCK